ncbi:MAG: phosphatase PAP2 family protein [Lachnospiraceae bacterium]|nr:phosphatase PAP2 family protein [Lachnospiraceae bacterium]
MKKETYEHIMKQLEKDELSNYIQGFTSIFVFVTGLTYIVGFIYLYFFSGNKIGFYVDLKDVRQINYILVPLLGFIVVTIYRKLRNAPRPYEVYEFTPLYRKFRNPAKRKKGESFPSRHVFSCFAVGYAVFSVFKPLGIAIIVMAVWLGIFRVVMGVHFPKDVIASAIIASILGIVGNIILPAVL